MERDSEIKLDNVIKELSEFLERDFSLRFKHLTSKEDRQLFFLANTLTQLKQISAKSKKDFILENERKVIRFPSLHRIK